MQALKERLRSHSQPAKHRAWGCSCNSCSPGEQHSMSGGCATRCSAGAKWAPSQEGQWVQQGLSPHPQEPAVSEGQHCTGLWAGTVLAVPGEPGTSLWSQASFRFEAFSAKFLPVIELTVRCCLPWGDSKRGYELVG